ncbi:cadherin EGF LAG seven-pass G-type receptor fmi-1-like [Argopecten irradians]|uniref:cadherin EGF LAG seven-pass G-type receptor fmi-1-like n=1 Tax=Argopecten irradians TaxID=31199 RepID=UPI003719097E
MAIEKLYFVLLWTAVIVKSSYGAAPTFDNLDDTYTMVDTGTAVTTIFTLAASDTDGDIQGYSMTRSAGYFSLVSGGTAVQTTGAVPAGVYSLDFRVMDATGGQDTGTLTVTVTNSAPVLTNAAWTATATESETAEAQIFLIEYTDASADDFVDCVVQLPTTPASTDFFVRYDTTNSKYAVYVQQNPTLTASSYVVPIACTDESGASATNSLTVTVGQNADPVFQNPGATVSVNSESTSVGTIVHTVTTTDTDSTQLFYNMTTNPTGAPFQIQDSGDILLSQSLLGLTQASYALSVYVYDGYNLVGPDIVTINVADINTSPTIDNLPDTATIPENSAAGVSIFQVTGSDADGDTLTYTAFTNPGSALVYLSMDSTTGLLSTSATNINFETADSTTVIVSVIVSDTKATVASDLTLTITNVNEPPTFQKTQYTTSGDEGLAGTSFSNPNFVVNDEDTGDAHTYSIDCVSIFSIDGSTGAISLITAYDVDSASATTTVTCTVTVSDSALTDTTTLVATINNINDNTPIFDPTVYVWYMDSTATIGTTVGSISATDADIGDFGTFSYTLDNSADAGYFGINSNGEVYVKSNVSNLGSSGSTLAFIATATDTGGLTANAAIQVIVPATTTTSTTTTTDRHMKFEESTSNVAWLTTFCAVGALLIGLLIFMAYRNGFFSWIVDRLEGLCENCRPGKCRDEEEEEFEEESEEEEIEYYTPPPPRTQKVATIGDYTWNPWKQDNMY